MSSAEEIREREAQSSTNQTPSIATDGDDGGDGDSGGRSLPVPSISRKHAALIGLIVAAVVAWKLYQRKQSTASTESPGELETDSGDGRDENPASETESHEGSIAVPQNHTDPLAADEAIVQEFRNRGTLSDPEGA